jgi:hypothetical protein
MTESTEFAREQPARRSHEGLLRLLSSHPAELDRRYGAERTPSELHADLLVEDEIRFCLKQEHGLLTEPVCA